MTYEQKERAILMRLVGIHGWPTCARCQKPVENLAVETDMQRRITGVVAYCHGGFEAIEIPRDVVESGEEFSLDGEAFSEVKQLTIGTIGTDPAKPGSESTVRTKMCDGKVIDWEEIGEIRIDVDEELLKLATPEERQAFQTNLFNFGSIATADYDADIDWSDSHHWIVRIPARAEREVRALWPALTEAG